MMSKVASQIVKCLRIKEGDVVLIHSWQHTINLAERIAVECYRLGADPLIALQTDYLLQRMAQEVPEDKLRDAPKSLLALSKTITVCIVMAGPEDPETMLKIPSEKLKALRISSNKLVEIESERKVRQAEILIGKVSLRRAKSYGLDFAEWMKVMMEALAVDYERIREIGKKLARDFEEASEVRISSSSGTDLRFRIDERPIIIEDGVIDEEDIEKGIISTYLPAGCLIVAPIEDSAEGNVVFDLPNHIWGGTVGGLEWFFERGKLKSWKASKGAELFKKSLEGMSGDRDRIGLFMIGLNPVYKAGYPLSEIALGTVSIGIGKNEEYGGKNKGVGVFTACMSGATVEVNGKMIMKDGELIYKF